MRTQINILHLDCMKYMEQLPDNHFELAIVDPPYFSGPERRRFYGQRVSSKGVRRVDYKPLNGKWTAPKTDYFLELERVSKNRIIWGINYFEFSGLASPGRIVWDKCNIETSYSDCEIASCSFHNSVRLFPFMWNGMLQGKSISEGRTMQGNKKLNEKRIHPTQKPVALYKWLLHNYAKPGDKILDTHLGSGSSAIAAHQMGYYFVGCELDKDYYEAAKKRIELYLRQIEMFERV